jgi:multidrug efflux pump subunit AcrA (membrane-fusion protein)
MNPTDTVMVEEGKVTSEDSAIGYIIREEEVLKGQNVSNGIIQIKVEGEKVSKNQRLFRYYNDDETELQTKIDEINAKIDETLNNEQTIFSNDINAIDKQIKAKFEDIKFKNSISEITEYKKDIDTYINKKSKIAGELSPAGSYIKELISQKEKYQNEMSANQEYVISKSSGIISYRIDNLESVLNMNNIENINTKMLEELDLKTGQIVTSSNQMGKVVNNFKCYIATNLKLEETQNVKVRR